MSSRIGIGYDVHPYTGEADRQISYSGAYPFPENVASPATAMRTWRHMLSPTRCSAPLVSRIWGFHFAESDPRWKGADSLGLLRRVAELVNDEGFALVNADCTVVGERPRLAAVREEMMGKLSEAAGGPVHVKATRPERMGALGREEGIACLAVALLDEVRP